MLKWTKSSVNDQTMYEWKIVDEKFVKKVEADEDERIGVCFVRSMDALDAAQKVMLDVLESNEQKARTALTIGERTLDYFATFHHECLDLVTLSGAQGKSRFAFYIVQK